MQGFTRTQSLGMSMLGKRSFTELNTSQATERFSSRRKKSGVSSSKAKGRKATAASSYALAKLTRQIKDITLSHPKNTRYISVYNTTLSSSLTTSAPVIQLLNGIAEGSDETQRVGDIGRVRWSKIKLQVFTTAVTFTTSQMLRVLVVREKTALGSAFAPAQYFNGGGTTPGTIALRNFTTRNQKRYVTYYDETKLLGPSQTAIANVYNGSSLMAPDFVEFDIMLSGLDFVTDYSRGNAGTVADIDTNSLYLIVLCDNVVNTSATAIYSHVTAVDF